MPPPRLSVVQAEVTGADAKNPGRFKGRADPKVAAIGSPPRHLKPSAKRAWKRFVKTMPWLTASDEAMLGVAAAIQGLIIDGADVGVTRLSLFQSVLSKLGASPTDRSKVVMPDDDEEEDEFFAS